MNACPPADTLSQLLVDALSGDELAAVESHVEQCPSCQQSLHQMARLADGPAAEVKKFWKRNKVEADVPAMTEELLLELSQTSFAAVARRTPAGSAANEWEEWPRIDGYEILGELGRGGMGVVYRARHLALDRPVALKVVSAGQALSPHVRQRFQQEARAVGRLHHPNIVQVYDVGDQGGRPFLAMELVEGGNLARRLHGQPQPPRSAARLVETLARAIQYAHAHGIVHRDMKPANVLVCGADTDARGVKITDFGLAKDLLADAASLTQSGAMLGTPSYMAPEQARGAGEPVGPATDVYALGAVLYELLTGRPPFRAASPLDTIVRVVHVDPLPISRIQPSVPRDLSTICLKCLEKEPTRRYSSADALADDLRRFLTDQPILGRPVGRIGRLHRWSRRNPALAALLIAASGLAVVALGAVLWQWQEAVAAQKRESDALAVAQSDRDAADEARRRAERAGVSLLLDRGLGLCEQGEVVAGLLWLAKALEQAEATRADDLEFTLRANIGAWAGRSLMPRAGPSVEGLMMSVAFTADGRRLLTAGIIGFEQGKPSGRAQFWDVETFRPVGPPIQDPEHFFATCTPDGSRVVTRGNLTGKVCIYDAATGMILRGPLADAGFVKAIAVSPDGTRLATGGVNTAGRGEVRLWDLEAGQPLGPPLAHPAPVNAVAFSRDGSALVTGRGAAFGGIGGQAQVWDIATGAARGGPIHHTHAVTAVAFSPSGRVIATGSADHVARTWDAESGQPIGLPRPHSFPVEEIAFGGDDRTVISAGSLRGAADSCGALVWDTLTGKPLNVLLAHPLAVTGVAIRSDGLLLATSCYDGHTRLYHLDGLQPTLDGSQNVLVRGVRFSPDGRFLLTSGNRMGDDVKEVAGSTRLWDLTAGAPVGPPLDHNAAVLGTTFDTNGRPLCIFSKNGTVRVWDAAANRFIGAPIVNDDRTTDVIVSPDHRHLIRLGATGKVGLWDLYTGRPAGPVLDQSGPVDVAAFSPSGTVVALFPQNARGGLWDIVTGRPIGQALTSDEHVTVAAFSPDGRMLIAGDQSKRLRSWNALTGEAIRSPRSAGAVPRQIKFSKDGGRFLTISGDSFGDMRTAQFWDATTLAPLGPPLPRQVSAIAFHPNGRLAAIGGNAGDVRLWNVISNRPVGPTMYHFGVVTAVAFDGPGRRLAVASGGEGRVRVWPVADAVGGSAADVRRSLESRTGYMLGADGSLQSATESERFDNGTP